MDRTDEVPDVGGKGPPVSPGPSVAGIARTTPINA